jgi:hypothetical protein
MNILKLIVVGIVLFFSTEVKSQVSVNVNIGSPPMWGPVGYTDVRYYYLPDIEAYYDIETSMFFYFGGGVWIQRAYLPDYYRNYDLYNGYKVVITDYRGNEPYIHFHDHKLKYKKGYRGGPQKTIGPKPGKGNNNNSQQKRNSDNQPKKESNQKSDQPKKQSNQRNSQPQKQMNQGNTQHEGNGSNKGGSQGGGGKGRKK